MKQLLIILTTMCIIFTVIINAQTHRKPFIDDESSENYLDIREQTQSSTLTDSNLTLVGEWPWGPCYAVAVRDSYALIGNGKLIQIMDISDPSNPTVAAEYNTGGLVRDIKLRDTLAFVCTRGGLQILNISNLFSPQEISFISLIAAREVVPTDSFAYVLGNPLRNPTVYIIDISDLANPYIRSITGTAADFITRLAAKDRIIYVTGFNFPNFTIIDARNPDSLVHHDVEGLPSASICIQDTFLYLGIGLSLGIFSISNPLEPVLLDTIYWGAEDIIRSMTAQGKYVYTSSNSGNFVLDVSNPYEPIVVGYFKVSSRGQPIVLQNSLLHMATRTGYNIINVANIDSMFEVGKFLTGGRPNDIAIQGNYAYVATGRPGLTILDLTNPTAPVRVGVLPLDRETWHIIVADSTAYLGADSTVYIIDISNKSFPLLINTIKADTWSVGYLYENNKRLYIIHPSIQTLIYDVSNFQNLILLGSYPLAGRELVVRDSIAYHANGTGGFVIMNIGDIQNTVELSRLQNSTYSIKVRDTIIFMAITGGLMVLNVSNPSNPESLSFIGAPLGGIDISSNYKYMYMSSYKRTMIIDMSDLRNLIPVGIMDWTGSKKIITYDKYIFICQDYYITILQNDLITSVNTDRSFPDNNQLLQNYPNPFNARTNISFELSHSSSVSLRIYNLLGNEISTLLNEQKPAGIYNIELNAEGLPSGIYYYRLQTGKYFETKKMLLIR
ncbi:MAG: T9SS type A sorting domain-containing protein [Bacteroidota bacterium]|nr:T9SS type A sorting domain-containing protein [Bacteroidota bacterium]